MHGTLALGWTVKSTGSELAPHWLLNNLLMQKSSPIPTINLPHKTNDLKVIGVLHRQNSGKKEEAESDDYVTAYAKHKVPSAIQRNAFAVPNIACSRVISGRRPCSS